MTIPSLTQAVEDLLAYIRLKHPEDFKPGGQGFTCPYHSALQRALIAETGWRSPSANAAAELVRRATRDR